MRSRVNNSVRIYCKPLQLLELGVWLDFRVLSLQLTALKRFKVYTLGRTNRGKIPSLDVSVACFPYEHKQTLQARKNRLGSQVRLIIKNELPRSR